MRLLVTRPDPDGARTAEALRTRGHDVLVAPVLRMEPLDIEIPDRGYGAVVLTSANAVRAIAAHPQSTMILALPVLAVGQHTADAARAAGFRNVRSADGDSSDLLRVLKNGVWAQPHLYLAGEDHTSDLAQSPNTITVVVYRMIKVDRLGPTVEAALDAGQIAGVLHFSRRSAQAYLDCSARADMLARALAPLQFCLSKQVAAPLQAAGVPDIKIAPRAQETALIALISEVAAAAAADTRSF
jgi:uroporphyrinogen-III synthase